MAQRFDSQELPPYASVVDVTARDGLQMRSEVVAPPVRREWVRRLLEAGVPEVEAGSFVRPDRLPQLAATAEVLQGLEPWAERLWVVVPNRKGLLRALGAGAKNLLCLLSASETHSRENLGRPIFAVLQGLEEMVHAARQAGARVRAALSMAWVDPSEGRVPLERAVGLCQALAELGFAELTLCDTFGQATPTEVAALVAEASRVFPVERIGLHLHDGAGQALLSVRAGLALGVTRFEAALARLGGCPFAPGAASNLDTELLVRALHSLGVATGIDPVRLAAARAGCLADLERPAPRRLGPGPWARENPG